MSDIITKNESPVNALLWTREEEELLKDWADIANKFRWLHERSSMVFRKKNNKIALPVIMISTLTGTANFGIGSLVPQSYLQTAQVVIGGANILCGILTTIQTYYKYAENTEAHYNASKLWTKFQNLIAIELAIEPSKRKNPTVFLKFCIEEYNKLKEYSPQIPHEITHEFKSIFRRKHLKLPDIHNEINPTLTYNDYLIKNSKMPTIPKSPKSIFEIESTDIETGKKTTKTDLSSPEIELENVSGISIENNIKSVEKHSTHQKHHIKNELDNLKPNVNGLINSLQKTISSTLKNKLDESRSAVRSINEPMPPKPLIKKDSIILNSDVETNKNNLKHI